MSDKILIVDDETEIADLIDVYLRNENYEVLKFYSPKDALAHMGEIQPDLAILDIMMPEINGFTLCQKIRERYNFPIIMLTAKEEETDKLTGLTLGADDYITKPFVISEVLARVRAVLRRSHVSQQYAYNLSKGIQEPDIVFKTLRVDRNEKTCYLNGEPVTLTKTEFEILMFFLTHRGRIYSREEIIREVWPEDVVVSNRTIDTNITRLRKKIEPYGNNITRLGFGYGFKETV